MSKNPSILFSCLPTPIYAGGNGDGERTVKYAWKALGQMIEDVTALALAYYLCGRKEFAKQSIRSDSSTLPGF